MLVTIGAYRVKYQVLQFPKLDLEQLADLLQIVRSCFLYLFY